MRGGVCACVRKIDRQGECVCERDGEVRCVCVCVFGTCVGMSILCKNIVSVSGERAHAAMYA